MLKRKIRADALDGERFGQIPRKKNKNFCSIRRKKIGKLSIIFEIN